MGQVIIIVGFAVLVLALIVVSNKVARKAISPSKKDEELVRLLMERGSKARATVTSCVPTGITVNNHNVQVDVGFSLEPLDGGERIPASKKMYLFRTQFPRSGDVWPGWFDPQDPSVFAVAAPLELDAAQIPMYREFGIDHPLDAGGNG